MAGRFDNGTCRLLERELQVVENSAMATSVEQTQDGCIRDPTKNEKKLYFKLGVTTRSSIGCWVVSEVQIKKSQEAYKYVTHTKEDRMACRHHSQLAIALCTSNACDQLVTSTICGRGFASISAHPLLKLILLFHLRL